MENLDLSNNAEFLRFPERRISQWDKATFGKGAQKKSILFLRVDESNKKITRDIKKNPTEGR